MGRMILAKRRKPCFFEKKNQKTFVDFVPGCCGAGGLKEQTFFASFFKKEVFLSLEPVPSILSCSVDGVLARCQSIIVSRCFQGFTLVLPDP